MWAGHDACQARSCCTAASAPSLLHHVCQLGQGADIRCCNVHARVRLCTAWHADDACWRISLRHHNSPRALLHPPPRVHICTWCPFLYCFPRRPALPGVALCTGMALTRSRAWWCTAALARLHGAAAVSCCWLCGCAPVLASHECGAGSMASPFQHPQVGCAPRSDIQLAPQASHWRRGRLAETQRLQAPGVSVLVARACGAEQLLTYACSSLDTR